jgi:hypothetical protein
VLRRVDKLRLGQLFDQRLHHHIGNRAFCGAYVAGQSDHADVSLAEIQLLQALDDRGPPDTARVADVADPVWAPSHFGM